MERVERYRQAYSQAPWRAQLHLLGVFLAILIVITLVAGVYLNITARADTAGREIQNMLAEIKVNELRNQDLRAILAAASSTSEMEARARRMNFDPLSPEQAMYIVVPGYFSRQPVMLSPASEPPLVSAQVTPPEYTESLVTWMRRKLSEYIARASTQAGSNSASNEVQP